MCKKCRSVNETELQAEICVHVPGLERLDTPVLVFPKLRICLDCGATTFAMPGTELQVVQRTVQLAEPRVQLASDEFPSTKDRSYSR
jgi:hypothetical protein